MFININHIFIHRNERQSWHDFLRKECAWGGSDKTWKINDLVYDGYEISSSGSRSGFTMGQIVDHLNSLT